MQDEIQKLKKKVVYFQEMLESKQSMLEMTISYMDDLQNDLEENAKELATSNKKLNDSNSYAERLQKALLPANTQIASIFPNSFVLFQPKFALSGDFYWFHETEEKKCVAVIDCTGHGVPGAMLTVMIDSGLNQLVKVAGITDPKTVLTLLDQIIHEQLHKSDSEIAVRDGADAGFFEFDKESNTLSFSGAHCNAFYINNETIEFIKGNRYSIGEASDRVSNLENETIKIYEKNRFFMYTDGIVDQFGGETNKKFGRKKLQQIIEDTSVLGIKEQKSILTQTLYEWKKQQAQTDDMLLIGIEF
jgi:serine phosphatase RsbU (regulator of sigma subunit)